MIGEATGEVEVADDGVIVLERIHVVYTLRVDEDADDAKIQRAFDNHMPKCPVYRSLGGSIDCTTELVLERS